MTRRRSMALVALAASAFVAGVGLVALYQPFGLLAFDRIDLPIAYCVAAWLLTIAAVILWRPRRRWVLIGALPTLGFAYVTLFGALFATVFDYDELVVRRVVSPDGRSEVRLVEVMDIDPIWEARLRTRAGLLTRERTVWRTVEWPVPENARFTGPDSIEVVDSDGKVVYAATF